jgi:hypothetical protein
LNESLIKKLADFFTSQPVPFVYHSPIGTQIFTTCVTFALFSEDPVSGQPYIGLRIFVLY